MIKTIPMTAAQKIVRDREAKLIDELAKEQNAQAQHAENWFRGRWGVEYSTVLPEHETQKEGRS